MPGSSSLELLAVAARNVASSSSPSKPSPTAMDINDTMRHQTSDNAAAHSFEGLDLGGGLYNLAAQASEASNSLGGAVYAFAAEASQACNIVDGGLYNLAAQASQAYNGLDDGLYNLAAQATQGADLGGAGLYNLAALATPGNDLSGGSSSVAIAAPDDPAPLKWGRKRRSRARREPHAPAPAPTPAPAPMPTPAPASLPTPTPAPEPDLIPAQAHRRAILKVKKRPAAQGQAQPYTETEKLMPPPSARRLLDTMLQTPRAATLSQLPPLAATLSQHRSSAEDPHAAAGEPQQQAVDKHAPRTNDTEHEPAPKVHEPKPQRQQPHRQAADKARHAGNGEQEPRQPTPQRQQPPRQASMKQKGKAPMVQEPPAVAPRVAVEAVAQPPVPLVEAQLTRKEKEEDWFAMTGTRLPYRPQLRRPKALDTQLQKLSPGLLLCEVTRAKYAVRQKKQKKRPGLKAMAEEDNLSSQRCDSDDDTAEEKKHFGVADAEEGGSRRKSG